MWLGFNFHVWLVFVCCSVRFYGDLAGFDPFDSIRFGDNIVLLFLRDRFFLLDTGQINPSRTSNREGLMLPGGKPEAELFVEAQKSELCRSLCVAVLSSFILNNNINDPIIQLSLMAAHS